MWWYADVQPEACRQIAQTMEPEKLEEEESGEKMEKAMGKKHRLTMPDVIQMSKISPFFLLLTVFLCAFNLISCPPNQEESFAPIAMQPQLLVHRL